MTMDLFSFTDYKSALKEVMEKKWQSSRGLYRKIADHLGVHPTLVSQVFSGVKDFTEEQMILICEFFGLPGLDSQYLMSLLQKERAGSLKLKNHFENVGAALRKQAQQISSSVGPRTLSDYESSVFYSSWIYSAIYQMTNQTRKPRFTEVCGRLDLPAAKAQAALDFLLKTGLVTEKAGHYHAGEVQAPLPESSSLVARHHTLWRLKAIDKAETLSEEELMQSLNVSLSVSDFQKFRKELSNIVLRFRSFAESSSAEKLAQLNIDFFWIENAKS